MQCAYNYEYKYLI